MIITNRMDTAEYNLIERIILASHNKIHLGHRARRELPLRRVILASRTLEMARNEQNRLLMAEAENIRLIRQEQWDDWWFTCNNNTTDPEIPSALLDTNTLLDTGIIDFESSPLFTAPPASPSPLLDFEDNDNNSLNDSLDVGDWSWLKEDKILEPISASVLLSHINYDEEEEESESEEDDLVVVLVNKPQQQQDSNWITIIPQKEKRSLQDEEDLDLPLRKKIST